MLNAYTYIFAFLCLIDLPMRMNIFLNRFDHARSRKLVIPFQPRSSSAPVRKETQRCHSRSNQPVYAFGGHLD